MKRWICSLLVLLSLLSCMPFSVAAQEAEETVVASVPETEAQNILIMSMDTGAVVYEKDSAQKIYPASITKIMTMILVLEHCGDLEEKITVPQDFDTDKFYGTSVLPVARGEEFTVRNLLYALALKSANDAAEVLAAYVSGDITSFAQKMTTKAKEVGAANTNFVNPHGLHDENHYTTAADVAKIMSYCLKNNDFVTLMSTVRYTMPQTNKHDEIIISSTNQLISKNGANASVNYYEFACGGKTGTTTPAGYNLVSWASKGDKEFICVAMNAPKAQNVVNPIFKDSKELYQWVYDSFSWKEILNTSDPQKEISVELATEKDYVVVTAKESISTVLRNDVTNEDLVYAIEVPEKVQAPVVKGDVIGTITVSDKNGVVYGTTELIAGEDIARSTVLYIMFVIKNIVSNIWVRIIGGVILLLIIIYIIVMIRRNRRAKRRALKFKPRIRY